MHTISKFDFARQIRQALQNLHDYASLQKLPISSSLSGPNRTLDQGVRLLRSEILAAIEQLNPPGTMPQRAKERRPYALLYGRYVQGMTTAELVEELAISMRQLSREHTRALNAVTELMWTKLSTQLADDDTPASLAPSMASAELIDVAQTEAEQLISQGHVDDLALADLIDGVFTTLASVARGHNILLVNRLPNDLPLIRANRVVIRQGMMGLLSYVLQLIQAGQIIIESSVAQGIKLRVNALEKYESSEPGSVGLDISQRLISSLGGRIEINATPESWRAEITLPIAEDLPVLIMDDNAGLIELFRRYLAGRGYRVFEAHVISEVIEAARKVDLKLIILDVMMPEQDGWEILQRLKEAPETKSVPVMICSVLNEPELAHIRCIAGGERVLQIILERGLVIFPVNGDFRIGFIKAGDRGLDVVVESRRKPEGSQGDFSAFFHTFDHTLGVGSGHRRDFHDLGFHNGNLLWSRRRAASA